MYSEKELVITELKEKVVVLSSRNRQLEIQVKDLNNQNMQVKILSAIVLFIFDYIIGNFMMYFNIDLIEVLRLYANIFHQWPLYKMVKNVLSSGETNLPRIARSGL